jgi:hypothetical protein
MHAMKSDVDAAVIAIDAEVIAVDAELRSIAVQRQQLHAREAVLLVRAEELELWKHFGCCSLLDYLERVCDLHPRTAKEYVRVARALTQLPIMRGRLEARTLVYSTVRELSRIATTGTEAEWLDHVAGMTHREIEAEVSGRKKGDGPRDPKDPDHMVKLVIEVRASTMAQWVAEKTRRSDARGERIDDEAVLLDLLQPHGDDDLPPYQVAITTCRECGKHHQLAGGKEIEVPPSTAECARCDAISLGDLEAETPPRIIKSVTKRMKQQVKARDGYACCVPGCRSKRFLSCHHIEFKRFGGKHVSSNIITICAGHHRALHEGKLGVSGKAPHHLSFTWADDPLRISTRQTGADVCPVGTARSKEMTLDDVARAAEAALRDIPMASIALAGPASDTRPT